MNRSFALFVIGLAFGGGIGFVLAAANGVTLDGHVHADDRLLDQDGVSEESRAGHDHHKMLDLAQSNAPTVDILVQKDPDEGWNLHVMTTGFTFSPANAGRSHVPGEGHAHVHVDGRKIARLYGPWMHIGTLPEGEVEIQVTLNANDHRLLSVDGVPVEARVLLGK
ncbi:MAG: hypothetical protein F4186_13335 [Boseongicola sp. SB0676_bin_33]|uniref:Copper chaperone PCu(A)C n=1 Tax=Boseongicola sp. SB0664_bin_43 TaxID=2604844 RepID=A0A6B0Y2K1_9RHOB|nr:hypothetical protein [Boseongicola sp. SB0664_bin_43]MYF90214.1 hypothetical protein [Boseongicola sp. SB0676_bin_33]